MKLSKYILPLVVILLISALYGGDDISQTNKKNLLRNGSFENVVSTGKPFLGWNAAGSWREIIGIGREAMDGSHSLLFTSNIVSKAWLICYSIPVEVGKIYKISWFMKMNLPKMPLQSQFGIFVKVISQGEKIIFKRYYSGVYPEWKKFQGEFQIQDGKYARIEIGLEYLNGFCWIDDIRISSK